jgi:hypothetical protein
MQVDKIQLDRVLSSLAYELPSLPRLVKHEIKYRGLPGFVSTFKKLKSWAFQILSGKLDYSEEWFVTKKYLGVSIPIRFKVVFQPLVRAITRGDFNTIRFLLSALNIYHIVDGPHGPEITKQIQIATQDAPTLTPNMAFYSKLLEQVALLTLPRCRIPSKRGNQYQTGQTVAIRPGVNGTYAQWIAAGGPYSDLEEKLQEIREQENSLSGFDDPLFSRYLEIEKSRNFMGNFSVVPDTGGKTRLILIGTPTVQARLKPLKVCLLSILKEIPTDCTFNQQSGVEFIKTSISTGKTVYSVDLKDATWNFPLSLQEVILKVMGVHKKDRNVLFRSQAFSKYHNKFFGIKKGQAMGLGPSFPLFSLTHNLILCGMCKYRGIRPFSAYRVLGDDVIINDDTLYREYVKFLEEYQVPVSSSKTFISSHMGEFAGRVIYKGVDITPIKWKRLTWESIPTLYWEYRRLHKNIPDALIYGRGSKMAYDVLSPLSIRLGGLGIHRCDRLASAPRYSKLRCGYIQSLIEGLLVKRTAFGRLALKQPELNIGPLEPYVTADYLRELGRRLTSYNVTSKFGILPYIVPDTARFLSQVGEEAVLLPERVGKNIDPKTGLPRRIAFKRYANNKDWKTLQRVYLSEEMNDVKTTSKTSSESENTNRFNDFFEV